jgi:hypothetical protein
MRNSVLILVLLSLLIHGCSNPSEPTLRTCGDSESLQQLSASRIIRIEYGASFGMCLGYCKSWIEASGGGVTFTKAGWLEVKPVSCSATFPCPIWSAKWSGLVSAIDLDEFQELGEVIGCPDCADGGTEWVEITTPGGKHKVTYEYDNPPDAIKPFRKTLFDLMQSFNGCD